MARPIEETPVLKGRDSLKFERNLEQAKKEQVPAIVLSRIMENYKKMVAIYKDR